MKSHFLVAFGSATVLLAGACAKFDSGSSSQGVADQAGNKACGPNGYPLVVLCKVACEPNVGQVRASGTLPVCPYPAINEMSWQEVYFTDENYKATLPKPAASPGTAGLGQVDAGSTGPKWVNDYLCTMNPYIAPFNQHNVVGKVRSSKYSNRPLRADEFSECTTETVGPFFTPGDIVVDPRECAGTGLNCPPVAAAAPSPTPTPSPVPLVMAPVVVSSRAPTSPSTGMAEPGNVAPALSNPSPGPTGAPSTSTTGGTVIPPTTGVVQPNAIPANPPVKYFGQATYPTVIKASAAQGKDLSEKEKCSVKKDEKVAIASKSGLASGHMIVILAEKRCQFNAGDRVFLFLGHFNASTLPPQ